MVSNVILRSLEKFIRQRKRNITIIEKEKRKPHEFFVLKIKNTLELECGFHFSFFSKESFVPFEISIQIKGENIKLNKTFFCF